MPTTDDGQTNSHTICQSKREVAEGNKEGKNKRNQIQRKVYKGKTKGKPLKVQLKHSFIYSFTGIEFQVCVYHLSAFKHHVLRRKFP